MGKLARIAGSAPFLTSKSISDYEIANPDPKVSKVGHTKPYSSAPVRMKKLSARKDKKDGNT